MRTIPLQIKTIESDGKYQTQSIEVVHHWISLKTGFQTGNWFPEGTPWICSIRADITRYANRDNWRYGLAAWGADRTAAIQAAYKFCIRESVQFPDNWLEDVLQAIEDYRL